MTPPTIDPEFQSLIPPLSQAERDQLEANIVADGCRDPLTTWRGVLLDGHNRYKICDRLGIPFDVFEVDLPDREAAEDWIDANQLGRRNLAPDQMSLLRGRRYNRLKRQGARTDITFPQNEGKSETAEILAEQYGVSRATIERDGQFASAVDKLKSVDPDIEIEIVSGNGKPKAAVIKAAALLESHPDKAMELIRNPEAKTSDIIREIKKAEVVEKLESTEAKEAKAASGVYDVIVIDPPWDMQKIERDVRENQVKFDYPTMTEEELSLTNVPCADDCHVWVWTTPRFLPSAIGMLDGWGNESPAMAPSGEFAKAA